MTGSHAETNDVPASIRVLNCLHRSHAGGAHWRALWVGEELESMGIETILLFPADGDDAFERHLEDDGRAYVRTWLPGLSRRPADNARFLASILPATVAIRRTIRERGVHLVHANGVTNVLPVLAALWAGVPVVWHFNDMQTPRAFVRLVSPLLRHRRVHLVVATEAIVDRYGLRAMPSHAWTYLPAPLPRRSLRTARPADREDLGIPVASRVLGFVGNLHPVKGVHAFLDAVVPVLTADERLHAVVVGPDVPTQPGYAEEVRRRARATDVAKRIHFVGFQSNVVAWLEMFDVFVFPSTSEACPIVVLEAMEAGTPIVATRVGDVPRMLDGIGVPLVAPGDVGGLTSGVERMLRLDPSTRDTVRERLRERVRARYSLDRVVRLHADVYRSLLA